MGRTTIDNFKRGVTLIKIFGITALVLLLLVNIAGALPFAYITNSGSNTVSVIDTATNKVTATVNVGVYPFGVAVSPDGSRVYITNMGTQWSIDTVSVIDSATNNVIANISVGKFPAGVAVSPDGKKLYVAIVGTELNKGRVVVFDTSNYTTTNYVLGGNPCGIIVSPDGKKIYVSDYYGTGRSIAVIDTTSYKRNVIATGFDTFEIALNPTGTKLYVTNVNVTNWDYIPSYGQPTVSTFDTATNKVTSKVNVGVGPYGVAVSPDGKKIYVSNQISGTISIIDTATNKVTATLNTGIYKIFGVAVTTDGKKVYVANGQANSVSVIDTATNKVTTKVNVGDGPTAFGQFIGPKITSPNAAFIASPTTGKAPLTVKFNERSTGSPGDYSWTAAVTGNNLGQIISTDRDPVYTFTRAGNYTISLTVKNAAGVSTKTIPNLIKVK